MPIRCELLQMDNYDHFVKPVRQQTKQTPRRIDLLHVLAVYVQLLLPKAGWAAVHCQANTK